MSHLKSGFAPDGGINVKEIAADSKILHPTPTITQPGDCANGEHLNRIPTQVDDHPRALDMAQRTVTSVSQAGPPHSVFSRGQKRFIVAMASWAGFFSPVSATIYLPALVPLAQSLHVSNSLINLTLTSYMIFQGLAPAFIGSLADSLGRRPAYLTCFVIYISANIGLALQSNYAALFILRCLQSTGSSATIALSSAVVSDVSTPAERGSYMGFTLAGSLLGPALGPVLGGILAEFLSWRAIFWFLTIFAGCFLIVFAVFFPETARPIVGNGSIPPQAWTNMSLMNYLAARKQSRPVDVHADLGGDEHIEQRARTTSQSCRPRRKRAFRLPNPLASLKILWDKENAVLLSYNAFLFAAFYDISATIPSQFKRVYGFNELQVGLCFIPYGTGSLCAALVNGRLLDHNFRRWCDRLGVKIKKGRDQDLSQFPIEKVRLQIAIPATYMALSMILVFGWVLNYEGPLAVLLIVLFIGSFSMSLAFNVTSTLLVDFYPRKPATATAANNLARCLLGAGATGVIVPMIEGMGIGWTFTFLSLFLLATSPMLFVLLWKGMAWREERRLREERKVQERIERQAGREEEEVMGEGQQQSRRPDSSQTHISTPPSSSHLDEDEKTYRGDYGDDPEKKRYHPSSQDKGQACNDRRDTEATLSVAGGLPDTLATVEVEKQG